MTATWPWPFGADGIDEPSRGFATLRRRAPVLFVEPAGAWAVTGYHAVTALLRDERCVTMTPRAAGRRDPAPGEAVRRTLERMVLLTDPPDHQRRRLPVQRAFEPAVVSGARDRIRHYARDLMDGLQPPADLVAGLARPLFDLTFDDLLRFPVGTTAAVRTAWGRVSAVVDDPTGELTREHDQIALALHERLGAHLAAVRAAGPGPGGPTSVDVLVAVGDDLGVGDADLVANLVLALSSGHRSATQALALALRALARHPAQLARWPADPAGRARAVEELLRWDGSVQYANRRLVADVEVHGCPVPAGALVSLAFGGANHDPAVYPDDELDVLAARRPHLSFGRGIHYCAGAALARIALAEALGAVAETVDELTVVVPPTFTPARRGLDSLVVTW